MLVCPMHQAHHSTQRQYHKEHCKNDYRHNLEPSAATAFRSAQHNRLSTLKLAIYLAAKISKRPGQRYPTSLASNRSHCL
jgi:hypothetical protein